ncbi:DUF1758 domain-containing protein [Trichonephila clavipes]|nr:DUF1758 domain-containing protein [Trichonephila clavipes]
MSFTAHVMSSTIPDFLQPGALEDKRCRSEGSAGIWAADNEALPHSQIITAYLTYLEVAVFCRVKENVAVKALRNSSNERLEPIDENSACVEAGTTLHKHLRRGVNSNNFNYITCEEVKSVDSQLFFFIGYIVRASNKEPEKKGETYIQFAAILTANFQYYCSLRKVNSFESLCDLIISDKLFETLNKETATHIGIREAEDWFTPIDLAKECDIYISSRSGSHKEIPITYGYTEDPFKIDHKTLNQRLKRTIPNILKEKIKIALYAVIHLIAQETVRSVLSLKNPTSIIE